MQGGESLIENVVKFPACCSQVSVAVAVCKSNCWFRDGVHWLNVCLHFSFCFCDRITALPTGVLQIYGVEQKDAGNYRCVATTIANRRKSSEAVLSVIPGTHHVRFCFFNDIIFCFTLHQKHLHALKTCNCHLNHLPR